MDGVLCNFLKGAKDTTGHDFESKHPQSTELIVNKEDQKKIISEKEDFWSTLEPMEDAFDLWRGLVKRVGLSNIFILSAYANWDKANSTRGKKEWLDKNLPGIPDKNIHLVLREQKKEYASPDAILIDDYIKNTREFEKAGGLSITHINTLRTLTELDKLLKDKK